jgi:hypothetical protein
LEATAGVKFIKNWAEAGCDPIFTTIFKIQCTHSTKHTLIVRLDLRRLRLRGQWQVGIELLSL